MARELAGGLEASRGDERKGKPEPGRSPAQSGLQVMAKIGQAMPDSGRLRRFPNENNADERDPNARDEGGDHPRDSAGRGDEQRTPAEEAAADQHPGLHAAVQAAALVFRDEVDGHGVDRHVLGRGEEGVREQEHAPPLKMPDRVQPDEREQGRAHSQLRRDDPGAKSRARRAASHPLVGPRET